MYFQKIKGSNTAFEMASNRKLEDLRIALAHDWLTGYRGGEKVLEVLCEIFPKAPLYTLIHVEGSVPKAIEGREVRTSFLQKMPAGKTKYRHYLPLFPLAAEQLIDSEFDLIISTSHAVMKSLNTRGAKHWCYIHSPMRYVWDRFDDYFGPERVGALSSRLFFKPIAKGLALYDRETAGRVQTYVANSNFVAERVRSFYGRESEVIHPPVSVERFRSVVRNPKDHYLFFSALVPYKRADLAIQACQSIGRKLHVVGSGPELLKLRQLSDSKWVEFHEKIPEAQLLDLFSSSRAMLFPAVEDFGIAPVEATASGLPIIGLRAGGLLDSQTAETCEFFDDQSADGLKAAILRFESHDDRFRPENLRAHAQKFSKERFEREIRLSLSRFVERNF